MLDFLASAYLDSRLRGSDKLFCVSLLVTDAQPRIDRLHVPMQQRKLTRHI